MESRSRRGLSEWTIAACGLWHIGLGLYFIFLRPPLLPEDLRYYLGVDPRLCGTALVLAVTGAVTLGLMSAVNFALHSDFRWLLVLPPIVWAAAVTMHLKAPPPAARA